MTRPRDSIVLWPLLVLLFFAPLPAQAGGVTFLESLPFDRGDIEAQGLEHAVAVAVRPVDGKYVYAVGRDGLSRWERDSVTGRLTFKEVKLDDVGGVDGIKGAFAVAVATAAGATHVYVVGQDEDALGVFTSAAADGVLTFVQMRKDGAPGAGHPPSNTMRTPSGIAVSADGAHVYVTALQDQGVVVFSRDAGTGALTYLDSYASTHDVGPFEGLDHPQGIALDSDGKFVYVAATRQIPGGELQGTIVVFRRDDDAMSGTFGKLAYESLVRDGQGTPVVQRLKDPQSLVVSPDRKNLYVASFGANALVVFSRNDDSMSSSFGDLTYLESFVDGGVIHGLGNAYGVTIAPNGQYVFVTGRNERALNVFFRDNVPLSPTLGKLSFVESQISPENKKAPKYPFTCIGGINDKAECDYPSACPGGTCSGDTIHGLVGPGFPAVTPDTKTLYVASQFPGTLQAFSIDTCGNSNRGIDEECDDGGTFCIGCKVVLCDSTPTTGCTTIHTTTPGDAQLAIKNDPTQLDTKDSMSWQWKKGNVPLAAAFGNPLTTADYVICVYDDSANPQPLASRAIPKGGPEWTQKIDTVTMLPKQFKYKNKNKSVRPDGIASMTLTAGTPDKASIKIKGKGGFLQPPALGVPGPEGLDVPVTVVVRNTETTDCWMATYDGIVGVDPKLISKNDEAQFKGKSQF